MRKQMTLFALCGVIIVLSGCTHVNPTVPVMSQQWAIGEKEVASLVEKHLGVRVLTVWQFEVDLGHVAWDILVCKDDDLLLLRIASGRDEMPQRVGVRGPFTVASCDTDDADVLPAVLERPSR